MSVFGAMTTAVTGLTVQAAALGNLSDNISNSQTTGFKRIETSFQSLVTQSNADNHEAGGVRARPRYTNDQQGTISQDQNATHMALSGNGFFQVSTGTDGASDVSFSNQTLLTRAGDFEVDRFGYLRNSSSMFLNGWGINSSGSVVRGALAPIRVQQLIDNPTATQNINLAANLPLTPPADTALPTQDVSIVDANGVQRTVSLQWRQQSQDNWRLSFTVPGSSIQPTAGTLAGINDQAIGSPLVATPGVTPVRQASVVTIGAVASGNAYTATVNGQSYTYTAQSFDTPATVAAQLFSQINGGGTAPGTLSISANKITLNGDAAGDSFTLTGTTTTLSTASTTAITTPASAGVAQVATATIGAVNPGSTYTLTVAGTAYSYVATTSDSAITVAQQLAALAGANASLASAVAAGGVVTMTAAAVNTAVTISASPTAGTTASQMSTVTAGGTVTSSTTTAASSGVAQVSTATIGTVSTGTAYSVALNGKSYVYTAVAGDTATTVGAAITALINADASAPATAANAAGTLTITGSTTGVAFTVNGSPTPVLGVKQQIFTSITGSTGDVGDVYTLNFAAIAGPPATSASSVAYTTDGNESNINTIVARLVAKVNANANSPVTAQANGAGIMFTAKTANTTSILGAISGTATNGTQPAHVDATFANGGYLSSLTTTNVGTGNASVSPTQTTGNPAFVSFQVNYGQGAQTIQLNLGKFGTSTGGLTQFAGTSITTSSETQDGFTRGAFSNININNAGDVIANYDNGRARVLARVPVIQVDNPNAMNMVNGNAFVETRASGGRRANDAGSNGAASLITSSVEGSNVDIAQEFTQLIITQRAYSANTKIITASDEMLQETLGVIR